MIINTLFLLRTRLCDYQPLTDYLIQHYGRPGSHFIGRIAPQKSEEYPFFAYILSSETETPELMGRVQVVVIRWDIHQPSLIDGDSTAYLGPPEHAQVGELILRALDVRQRDALRIGGEIRTLTDLYTRHPYYGGEMQLTINYSEM